MAMLVLNEKLLKSDTFHKILEYLRLEESYLVVWGKIKVKETVTKLEGGHICIGSIRVPLLSLYL